MTRFFKTALTKKGKENAVKSILSSNLFIKNSQTKSKKSQDIEYDKSILEMTFEALAKFVTDGKEKRIGSKNPIIQKSHQQVDAVSKEEKQEAESV
jgi:stalled ribosome alternative rescue factor ArfA